MKVNLLSIMKRYNSFLIKLYLLIRHIQSPLDMIEKFIPKKGRIADLGCGFGSFDIYLAIKSKDRELIGFELEKNRVNIAKKASLGLNNIKFEQRDFTKNTGLNQYDTILMFDLLHHIPTDTQKKLIQESKKKLKKKGILIIKDVDTKPLWKYYYSYFQDKIMTKNDKLYFINKDKMISLLKKEKFKIKQIKILKTWLLNPIPHIIYVCEK